MKLSKIITLGILVLGLASAWGQPTPNLVQAARMDAQRAQDSTQLTTFDLDFPGGSPRELVAAIQKATGKHLNVIISDEDSAHYVLPQLKMNNVNVAELFNAVHSTSRKVETVEMPGLRTGGGGFGGGGGGRLAAYQQFGSDYGFRTDGTLTDDSIWYFYASTAPIKDSTTARFYLLTPYLEQGVTVDDITTAIETAWKMLDYGQNRNQPPAPKISYHKETHLLIAVGDESKLDTIDAVLKALEPRFPTQKELHDQAVRDRALPAQPTQSSSFRDDLQRKVTPAAESGGFSNFTNSQPSTNNP